MLLDFLLSRIYTKAFDLILFSLLNIICCFWVKLLPLLPVTFNCFVSCQQACLILFRSEIAIPFLHYIRMYDDQRSCLPYLLGNNYFLSSNNLQYITNSEVKQFKIYNNLCVSWSHRTWEHSCFYFIWTHDFMTGFYSVSWTLLI